MGTWQSTLTDFKYVSKKWKDNCDEERLLGVSLTGIVDNQWTNGKMEGLPERLEKWRVAARMTNEKMASRMVIPASAGITCVKPSGTVSKLALCGSGIHAWHASHYIQRVRENKTSPIAQLLIESGVPWEVDLMKDSRLVFSFPIKAPKDALLRDDETAVQQLERWLAYKTHWCEHNPSITVTVREHEWMTVGAWVYDHFDAMVGVSFLPHSDHVYKQAPYEALTEEEYGRLVARMPKSLDWSKLAEIEKEDMTDGARELACAAGGCQIE
jgi:ribonucleoside-triphosphate reductase